MLYLQRAATLEKRRAVNSFSIDVRSVTGLCCKRGMTILQRIRRAVREQRYRISTHANEEMSEDDLEAKDVESIIFSGRVARRFTRDPRGTRYEVIGDTTDDRRGGVVCRLLPSGVLLIITAYGEEE